jgi:hypothetical protein
MYQRAGGTGPRLYHKSARNRAACCHHNALRAALPCRRRLPPCQAAVPSGEEACSGAAVAGGERAAAGGSAADETDAGSYEVVAHLCLTAAQFLRKFACSRCRETPAIGQKYLKLLKLEAYARRMTAASSRAPSVLSIVDQHCVCTLSPAVTRVRRMDVVLGVRRWRPPGRRALSSCGMSRRRWRRCRSAQQPHCLAW